VAAGREEDFEGVFKPGGIWQEFLQRSPGYLTSELVQFANEGGRYEVFDYWQLHEEFENCRQERQPEIERFKLLFLDGPVQRETLLGSFYEDGPDESGLVLG
jgi:hypothetical protein